MQHPQFFASQLPMDMEAEPQVSKPRRWVGWDGLSELYPTLCRMCLCAQPMARAEYARSFFCSILLRRIAAFQDFFRL